MKGETVLILGAAAVAVYLGYRYTQKTNVLASSLVKGSPLETFTIGGATSSGDTVSSPLSWSNLLKTLAFIPWGLTSTAKDMVTWSQQAK